MSTRIELVPMLTNTQFAPLGVFGYCLTQTDFLQPVFEQLTLGQKQVNYSSTDKLVDMLVSILAGCRAVSTINTRIRPDTVLAQAWGRERFAEQSTVARTLDAFHAEHIQQLRAGSEVLFQRESRTLRHNFGQEWLWLDIDLTPLPASKRAEGSCKGKIGDKKRNMVVS